MTFKDEIKQMSMLELQQERAATYHRMKRYQYADDAYYEENERAKLELIEQEIKNRIK